jgi:hypothetical protein
MDMSRIREHVPVNIDQNADFEDRAPRNHDGFSCEKPELEERRVFGLIVLGGEVSKP